jgi:hypothetical protein
MTAVETALTEYRRLYETALTWVDGDPAAARRLVEAYGRGRIDREMRERSEKETPSAM